LSSAYGDRTFNWAFLGLLLMPFVVAAGIGGALFVRYRVLRAPRGPDAARLAPSEESHRSPRGPDAARLALPSEERP
jgi:hypothetical protein